MSSFSSRDVNSFKKPSIKAFFFSQSKRLKLKYWAKTSDLSLRETVDPLVSIINNMILFLFGRIKVAVGHIFSVWLLSVPLSLFIRIYNRVNKFCDSTNMSSVTEGPFTFISNEEISCRGSDAQSCPAATGQRPNKSAEENKRNWVRNQSLPLY